jgi:hypothetical protein
LKKEKTNSRQSKKKPAKKDSAPPEVPEKNFGSKVLVPLLSKREAETAFIEVVANKAHEIILLLVIDTNAMSGEFGFATNEIAVGNALMQKIKEAIGKKRKTCNDVIEWGDTTTKIEHMAQLYQVDKVYMVKQANHFYKTLVKDMKEKLKGIEIEEIKLRDWEE